MAKPGFRLALFATLLALIVVLLGAYTRLTHAGLGCPDWPGCYGFISVPQSEAQLAHAELHFPDTPVEADKGWAEMTHRYFAGTLGLLIVLLAARSWSHRRDPGQPVKLPLFLLMVVFAQAAFGMDGDLEAVAPGGDGAFVGRFCDLEPAVSADPALVWGVARVDRTQAPAILGHGRPGAGDRSDRLGRLGQFQLRGSGLYRFAHLPWPVVACG